MTQVLYASLDQLPSGRRQGALVVTGSLQQNAVSAHKPALETHWTTVAELPTVPPTSGSGAGSACKCSRPQVQRVTVHRAPLDKRRLALGVQVQRLTS